MVLFSETTEKDLLSVILFVANKQLNLIPNYLNRNKEQFATRNSWTASTLNLIYVNT